MGVVLKPMQDFSHTEAQILLRRDGFYTGIHLYRNVFFTRYFYKEVFFCTEDFTHRCFYTQLLLD